LKTIVSILVLCGLTFLTCRGQDYSIEPAEFNSEFSDFGALYYGDGVVFISNREKKYLRSAQDTIFKYFTDIFYVPQRSSSFRIQPRLFAKEITGLLNEGPCTFSPDGNTLYYTGNIDPGNVDATKKIKEYNLGLFICHKENDFWSVPIPFEHNGPKDSNTAHPTISADGQTLVFMSNRPGGFGGADLYECVLLDDGEWSEPTNLGAHVNSVGDEVFPFLDEHNQLFYSSNHFDPLNGMEILKSVKINSSWSLPSLLSYPINSKYDDFAYSNIDNGSNGFISSSRDGEDNIYEFQFNFPTLTDCDESHEPIYCYFIEDINVPDVSNLPVKLKWNLGDGQFSEGRNVEHCYADTGFYRVSLDLIDTLTHQVFSHLSETNIHVYANNSPRILGEDTVKTGKDIEFSADLSEMGEIKPEYYFWVIDDSIKVMQESLIHRFSTIGVHEVAFGLSSINSDNRDSEVFCCTKSIVVVDSLYTSPSPKAVPTIKKIKLGVPDFLDPVAAQSIPNSWCVLIAESQKRLTFNNPIFAKIDGKFRESYNPVKETYLYTVGLEESLHDAYQVYRELADDEIDEAEVLAVHSELILKNTVQVGLYIEPSDQVALNRTFAGLSDVRFKYNSDVIMDTSFANLNYIASMLQLERDFILDINAHTCDMGGINYNKELSKRRARSVQNYLVGRGVPQCQIRWKGFGQLSPRVPNISEETRSFNRRVEFVIQFIPKDEIITSLPGHGNRMSYQQVKEQ
jgi:outer membrane protein OmpA-like peptidoglycan-associated protein